MLPTQVYVPIVPCNGVAEPMPVKTIILKTEYGIKWVQR
jgi:hypothetical protein